MTQLSATPLQAKILAINTINSHAKEIFDYETEQLSKLIGTNPLKVGGEFKAKIDHKYKEIERKKILAYGFEWWQDTHYYFTAKYGYFSINIRTCVSGGGADKNGVNRHCIYEDLCIDLFKINEQGIFEAITEPFRQFKERPQYEETTLLEIKGEIEKIAEQYRNTANKLPYQFAHVLNVERLTRS
jgi:hypothetical protein